MSPRATPAFESPRGTRWRRRLGVVLILSGLAVVVPHAAEAQLGIGGLFGGTIVYDPAAVGKLAQQIASQLKQVAMQRQQLEAQLTAMQKLHNPAWRHIEGVVAEIDAMMRREQSLAYSLAAIDVEFQRTFPGVRIFRDFPLEEATQATRTLATLRGALNGANRVAGDFAVGLDRLDAMKRQVAAAQGHEEALELGASVGIYSAEELMLLRQAIAAQTNVQAVYFADQVNSAAQERATFRANIAALAEPGAGPIASSLQVVP